MTPQSAASGPGPSKKDTQSKSIIIIDPQSPERLPLRKLTKQWVEVTGKVQFVKTPGKNEFVSSLILKPAEGKRLDSVLKVIPKPANPYVS